MNQTFVLLYSKYSAHSKKLLDLVQYCSATIQLVCVDNEKVRQRIKKSELFEISTVPCILSVYPDGTVEKYEGAHAFNLIEQFLPVQQPSLPQPAPILPPQPPPAPPKEPIPEENEPVRPPPRKSVPTKTSITDIEYEPEQDDRHRNVEIPKKIRKNDGSFDENEEFFQDEQPNQRRNTHKNPVKNTTEKAIQPNKTTEKAKAMQQMRDEMDAMISPQSQRPMNTRPDARQLQ